MATAKPADALTLLSRKQPPRVILIHGADRSAVTHLSDTLLRKLVGSNELAITRLQEAQIANATDSLLKAFLSRSMFGDREAILVEGGGEAVAKAVAPLLDSTVEGNTVIIESEALPKSAMLRKLAEAHPNAIACALYEESRHDLRLRLERHIRGAGYSISDEALTHLLEALSSERGVGTGEVEKLLTYMGEVKTIELSDVCAICAESHESSVDELLDAVFEGRLSDIERHGLAIWSQGSMAKSILPLALSYTGRLQAMALQRRQGMSISEIVNSPRNGIFFKRKPIISRQLQVWLPENLLEAEEKLAEAVLAIRQNPDLEFALTSRTLLALGWQARSLSS